MQGRRQAASLSPGRVEGTSLAGQDHRMGRLKGISVHFHQPWYFTEYEAEAQRGCDFPKVTGPKAKPVSRSSSTDCQIWSLRNLSEYILKAQKKGGYSAFGGHGECQGSVCAPHMGQWEGSGQNTAHSVISPAQSCQELSGTGPARVPWPSREQTELCDIIVFSHLNHLHERPPIDKSGN